MYYSNKQARHSVHQPMQLTSSLLLSLAIWSKGSNET